MTVRGQLTKILTDLIDWEVTRSRGAMKGLTLRDGGRETLIASAINEIEELLGTQPVDTVAKDEEKWITTTGKWKMVGSFMNEQVMVGLPVALVDTPYGPLHVFFSANDGKGSQMRTEEMTKFICHCVNTFGEEDDIPDQEPLEERIATLEEFANSLAGQLFADISLIRRRT